ncbi:MAG: TlpA family protein disulfide reductase [Pseudobdellovibrionaceae bacterium]
MKIRNPLVQSLLILMFHSSAFAIELICEKTPDFKLRNLNGEYESLENVISSIDGIAVMSIFQTTCEPCIEEINFLKELKKKNQDSKSGSFIFFLVSSREDVNVVSDFVRSNNLSSERVLLDKSGKLDSQFQIKLIPKMIFLDKKRRIISAIEGKELGDLRVSNKLGKIIADYSAVNPCDKKR